MTIILKPDTERLINEELRRGHYKDAEDVIQRALHTRPLSARCKNARRLLPVFANCGKA
jgi:hypothetical protein